MSLENRQRVLKAATDSFLARGYGSSVDDIARRAGVAKQTVYHHFPSKDRLFKEVARDLAMSVLVELEGDDVRAALLRFAVAYRARALGADGIATFRTLVPTVSRFKALAKAMYANTAGELVQRLSQYLEGAMKAGRLRRDDPVFAAEMLMSMLVGVDRVKRLFGVSDQRESDERRAARIVDCFLRAYRK
jgi:TetR/AcrR family transcriptional regulator, mexJK operon transcriptional repressor